MGLSSSKHNASPSSSSGPVVHRSRSTRSRILNSSCLGSHRADNNDSQVSNCPSEKNGKSVSCPSENKSGPCRASAECYTTDKAEQSDDMNCINSSIELHEWAESSFTGTREGSTSRAFSSRSLNRPNRFLSRFSFYPGNLSFRLNRTNSLGSARSTRSFTISNEDEECVGPSGDLMSRNVYPRGCDFFPACFSNRSPRTRDDPNFSNNFQDNQDLDSGNDVLINRDDTIPNLFSTVNHNNNDGGGIRHIDRRVAAREPVERNVRFSRTLSVGRLRDRVLRRTPPDYNFQEDSEVRHTRHINGHAEMEATSGNNNFSETVSSSADESSNFSDPFHGSQNHVYETPRTRETRYRDLLEHRSNFLERRRRIRSQVRALQRLGSRFENLSGHERACILSGQHRGGHCNCRFAAQEANSNDDPNARASMSRIVMLAEALFEVLDEIHQQSVVLSSRPSVSSIGSVPAPSDVVDSLPLKIFSKLKKKPSDDAAQCYICLVEYDDGDSIRVLPCHHEFHRACVDKWLKEIHRVCPLCRGDICHPGSLTAHN